ncbi:unnamed protein product [Ixodes hexagonus]
MLPANELFKRVGYLFYIASPNETSFEKLEDVPDYIVQAVPLFVVFAIVELVFNILHSKRDRFRIDDGLTSISQGMLQELSRIFSEGALLASYVYVYNNYRIITLPWNSAFTWFFAMLAVDFAYYWVHRCGHEMNLAWAGHQVHHSSEFYNLTTAMRQSVLQAYFDPILYMPLALVLSPSAYLVHHQFNRLYQFLIHTEAVQTLGPLEYILNTPSHHRVHHGLDRYCIDKNYGGTLIIWDRLFGTFEVERCRPAYGLTHPVNTFDPWTLQASYCVHHLRHIWNQVRKLEGFGNKLSAVFKGPGWEPGKSRLGNPDDIPDVSRPVEPYAPKTNSLCKAYVFAHFALLIFGYVRLNHLKEEMESTTLACGIGYITFSLVVLGTFLDGRTCASLLEAIRCALLFVLDAHVFHLGVPGNQIGGPAALVSFTKVAYACSLAGALVKCLQRFKVTRIKIKVNSSS